MSKDKKPCKACKKPINENDPIYNCITCNCSMHLEVVCTGLSTVALNGILELGNNALLICNTCLSNGKRDQVIRSTASHDKSENIKKIEEEISKLSKVVAEVSTKMENIKDPIQSLPIAEQGKTWSQVAPQNNQTPEQRIENKRGPRDQGKRWKKKT